MSEEQPLITPAAGDIGPVSSCTGIISDFEPGDADDARQWTDGFKYAIVLLLACMSFTVTFTCISVVPIASHIIQDLEHSEGTPASSSSALLVTIWELGEAAGPLIIAPLSEVLGRYPVMNTANAVFVAATLLAATCRTVPLFIVSRALTGLAVAVNVLNPAIIGDMFEPDRRGSAMSLIMVAPLMGGAVGPAFSGAVAERFGWRAVVLVGAALAFACELLFLTCFRETYKMAILRKRASRLLHSEAAGSHIPSIISKRSAEWTKIRDSISRPAQVLFGSAVLLAMSLFGAVSFSYFYVLSVSFPGIARDVYGLSFAQTGSAFLSFSCGSLVAIGFSHMTLDRIYVKLRGSHQGFGRPEFRLPLAIVAALLVPLAMSAYGWIAELRLPCFLFLGSAAFVNASVLLIIVPISAYVVDSCGAYAASAMTGVIVSRCLMGTFLPLTVGPLIDRWGYGWGFTAFGALSLCLAPIPVLVRYFGHEWRQKSEFTRDYALL